MLTIRPVGDFSPHVEISETEDLGPLGPDPEPIRDRVAELLVADAPTVHLHRRADTATLVA